jgi:uncharacterized protein (TIGR00290 family)
MKKGKVVVSWTGGKDGCLACYKAILQGFEVSYLLSFRDTKRIGSHAIHPRLLAAQSQAMGIPLLHRDFVSYEEEFKKVVRYLNEGGAGIEGAVFGHIQTHKNLAERMCRDLGVTLILSLWKFDSMQLVREFIEAGFEAIIVSARADLFDKAWLGRKIDDYFVRDLRTFNSAIDPCGEYGEFHTFVTGGPLFKNHLSILSGEKILRNGYWFFDISNYKLVS